MKRKVLLGIFSGVFFLLISTPAVGAAEWGGPDVLTSLRGRWTSTELESKVPGAKARAIAAENACTTKVNSLRASRLAAGDKSLMAQYTSNHNVFGSWYVWLSLKGSPLATEINVPSGSTDPVDLQLNYFWISCSNVVRSRNNPGNLENHDFIQNHLLISNTNWGNDIKPELRTATPYVANYQTWNKSYEKVSAVSISGPGSITRMGDWIETRRDDSSRYSFTNDPLVFRYTPPASGFTEDMSNIKINITSKGMRVYDNIDWSSPNTTSGKTTVYYCSKQGGGVYSSYVYNNTQAEAAGRINNCLTESQSFNIRANVTPTWTLVPKTTVDKTTAKPGEKIIWTHGVINEGPSALGRQATVQGGTSEGGVDKIVTGPWTLPIGFVMGDKDYRTSTYTIQNSDLGKKVCRGTRVNNYNVSSTGWSDWGEIKCVSVPYDYNLFPSVGNVGGFTPEPGSISTIDVKGSVKNDGSTASRPGGEWTLSMIRFNNTPDAAVKNGGESPQDACSWNRYSGKVDCQEIGKGDDMGLIVKGGRLAVDKIPATLGDYPVGTTICFVMSVKPYVDTSSDWRHSDLLCITYGKKPKVQVLGGDLITGRTINGSTKKYAEISTSLSTQSHVETTSTTKDTTDIFMDNKGLKGTGLKSSGEKAAGGEDDANWRLDSIQNPISGDAHNQGTVPAGGRPATVVKRGGSYTDKYGNTHNYIAEAKDMGASAKSAWKLNTERSVGWIFSNISGHLAYPYRMKFPGVTELPKAVSVQSNSSINDLKNKSIIWNFSSKFTIKDDIDPDTVEITLWLAADDWIEISFNDSSYIRRVPDSSEVASYPDKALYGVKFWTENANGSAKKDLHKVTIPRGSGVKSGENTIHIKLYSYSSAGGMIIDDNVEGRGEIVTVKDTNITKTYGSWGEYALVSNSQIRNMASASGLNGGSDSDEQQSWSNMTFANIFLVHPSSLPGGCISGAPFGCYESQSEAMPNVAQMFKGGTDLGLGEVSKTVDELKATSGIYKKSDGGTINLEGGTLSGGTGNAPGEWVVINAPNSTVNINNRDIIYNYGPSGSLTNPKNIPQMVIIAKDINISNNVTRIDSWLIANQGLVTCEDGTSGNASQLKGSSNPSAYPLTSKMCSDGLVINGPVMTNRLWLRRTAEAGAGDNLGNPAEIFNYRPDAMLWLNSRLNNGSLRTTNIIELPPRY